MRITSFKFKFLGRVGEVFRVLGEKGEVLHIAETKDEAQKWIDCQK